MANRVTNLAIEALIDAPATKARVTNVAVEALIDAPAARSRVMNVAIEVLRTVTNASTQKGYLLLNGI